MEEIWKDVKDFEGLYQVSNLGRVRSLDRMKNNHLFRGRILRQPKDRDGYCLVRLCDGKRMKNGKVHSAKDTVSVTFRLQTLSIV